MNEINMEIDKKNNNTNDDNMADHARMLSSQYLTKSKGKKDLIHRLRQICRILAEDESVEPDSPDFPGLASLCQTLVTQYLHHKDKQVRLYTVSACMELLTVYAPEAPFTTPELLQIFAQTIRQLANLSHTTITTTASTMTSTGTTMSSNTMGTTNTGGGGGGGAANFEEYIRILDLLAHVKIGVILVELVKEQQGNQDRHSNHYLQQSKDDSTDPRGVDGSNSSSSSSSSPGRQTSPLSAQQEEEDDALTILADLFQTLLLSVRAEHPPEILELCQTTICGCLEEFQDGVLLPIPLLDQLLLAIAQGPRVLVLHPGKAAAAASSSSSKRNKNSNTTIPAHHVAQANPAYVLASSILRRSVDRLSTPIAALLNGLLNQDPRLMSLSQLSTQKLISDQEYGRPYPQDQNIQADIFAVIYELHTVAPSMLTTVIGTVTPLLETPDVETRKATVYLLGMIFPKLATRFLPCFRQWLTRSQDKHIDIRLQMIPLLIALCQPPTIEADITTRGIATTASMNRTASSTSSTIDQSISNDVQTSLRQMMLYDPTAQVRLATLHAICDHAYTHPNCLTVTLWKSVGTVVAGKHKQERQDALTGLVQTYYSHATLPRLAKVVAGGDDVPLEVVQECLQDGSSMLDAQRWDWIPNTILRAAVWKEPEMAQRVWNALDDVLLGSDLSSKPKNHLTATARAVGLTLVIEDLDDTALQWLEDIWKERARVQVKLAAYLEARSTIKKFPVGSEEHLTANANALDLLEAVAVFCGIPKAGDGERNPVLERFHTAKDKYIFRCLSTIATPTHSTKARKRAVEEIPKRVKSRSGEAGVTFVKALIRKTAMGDFCNQEIIHHAVLLAQECGNEGDWASCRQFLKCIDIATSVYPEIIDKDSFQNLSELFSECQSSKEKGVEDIVTSVSGVLSKTASVQAVDLQSLDKSSSSIQKDLLRLCREGTPEQARHAVQTMTAMIRKGDNSDFQEGLSSLLNSLTTPSILSSSTSNDRLTSIFAALSVFAERAHDTMASKRGEKAITFALEAVLLGRGSKEANDDLLETEENLDGDQEKSSTTPLRRRSGKKKHLSPGTTGSLLNDQNLSSTCRKLCAAMELLTCYTRSSVFASLKKRKSDEPTPSIFIDIEKLFDTLCNILRDEGVPPSNSDREECKFRQDRAALRQSAAISLFRICDPRLGLDSKFLSIPRWHILAGVLLDDEKFVREKIVRELGLMLTGNGMYGQLSGFGLPVPPMSRFLSMVVLCNDGDHVGVNANAANIGKLANSIKMDATSCVKFMRSQYEVEAEQARANGPVAEQRFELGGMKVRLMPEYVLPYAFHLLSCRKETPYDKGNSGKSSLVDDDVYLPDVEKHGQSDVHHKRMLKKRLKWLFDPLVLSLGDTADNISFLIQMSNRLCRYGPRGTMSANSKSASIGESRLRSVCKSAREVLMAYVKKDINLASFPGQIMVPGNLFQRSSRSASRSQSRSQTGKSNSTQIESTALPSSASLKEPGNELLAQHSADTRNHSPRKQASSSDDALSPRRKSGEKHRRSSRLSQTERSKVQFSPELSVRSIPNSSGFGELSPIQQRNSILESPGALLDSGEKTRGSTPPSIVRDMTFTATANEKPTLSASITQSQSPASRASDRKRSLRSSPRILASKSLPVVAAYDEKETKRLKTQKKEKTSVPQQIKFFRAKPLQEKNKTKASPKKRRAKKGDDFDFDEDDFSSSIKSDTMSKNKENTRQSRPRKSKRRAT